MKYSDTLTNAEFIEIYAKRQRQISRASGRLVLFIWLTITLLMSAVAYKLYRNEHTFYSIATNGEAVETFNASISRSDLK